MASASGSAAATHDTPSSPSTFHDRSSACSPLNAGMISASSSTDRASRSLKERSKARRWGANLGGEGVRGVGMRGGEVVGCGL